MLTCSEPKNGARILATAYVPLHDKPVQASCQGGAVRSGGMQAACRVTVVSTLRCLWQCRGAFADAPSFTTMRLR